MSSTLAGTSKAREETLASKEKMVEKNGAHEHSKTMHGTNKRPATKGEKALKDWLPNPKGLLNKWNMF